MTEPIDDDDGETVAVISGSTPQEALSNLLAQVTAQVARQFGVSMPEAADVLLGLAVSISLVSTDFDTSEIKGHVHSEVDRHFTELVARLPRIVEEAAEAGIRPPDAVLRAANRQKGVYDA